MPMRDGGFRGSLMSMGGLRSRPGYGLQTNMYDATVQAAIPGNVIFQPNNKRVWVQIQNDGDAHAVQIYVGDTNVVAERIAVLYPHDSMTFDMYHPWTGTISGIGLTGDTNVIAIELELAGAIT